MSLLTARQSLELWTAELDKQLGWTTTVTTDGICMFQTHEGLIVSIEAPAELDIIVFHAPVGKVADLNDAALLRGLLSCNWYGMATGPGQLGLEPGGDTLVLSMAWLEAASAVIEQFVSMLTRFTTIAVKLNERIARGDVRDATNPAAAESTRFEGFTRV